MAALMNPLMALLAMGVPGPTKKPSGLVGPLIRYEFTFDDSDPDGAPFDLTEADAMVDQALSNTIKVEDDADVELYIGAIELEWHDDAMAELTDTQKWATVWDAAYLSIKEGKEERHYPLAWANRLFAETVAASVGGSNTGTDIDLYKRSTRPFEPLYVGRRINLKHIKKAEITFDSDVTDELGADCRVNVFIHGGVWDETAEGAGLVPGIEKELCHCPTPRQPKDKDDAKRQEDEAKRYFRRVADAKRQIRLIGGRR